MVSRINFIEKGKYALTYRNLAVLLGAWVLFCTLIYSIQVFYGFFVHQSFLNQDRALKHLSAERDRGLAILEMAAKNIESRVGTKGIEKYLSFVPEWSGVLRELEASLPKSVWLLSVASSDLEEGNKSKRLEIKGMGLNSGGVVQFVKNLSDSKVFRNAIITSMERRDSAPAGEGAPAAGAAGYTGGVKGISFIVNADVYFSAARWD